MDLIEDLVVDACAGYAFGRLVSYDTVTVPLANRLLDTLVRVRVPADTFDGWPPDTASAALRHVEEAVCDDMAAGKADMRQMHRDGWTVPRHRLGGWVADLVTCPICSSFHALWLSKVATGRARPLSARWWLRLFAGWGAAQVLLRLPAGTGAKAKDDYINAALRHAQQPVTF